MGLRRQAALNCSVFYPRMLLFEIVMSFSLQVEKVGDLTVIIEVLYNLSSSFSFALNRRSG